MPGGTAPVEVELGGFVVTVMPEGLYDASCVALIATTGQTATVITQASKNVPVVAQPPV